LLNEQKYIKYIFKFNKELYKYFNQQDLCI